MRLSSVLLAVVLAVAFSPTALAEDEPKLPFNPFEKAEAGDFAVYVFRSVGAPFHPPFKDLDEYTIVRVDKVAGDWAYLIVEHAGGFKETAWLSPEKRRLPRKGDLTLRAFDDIFSHRTLITELRDVKLADSKCSACGKEVDGKSLCYQAAEPAYGRARDMAQTRETRTLGLVESVKATGLAAMTIKFTDSQKIACELLGHGQRDRALWGKTPEDVEKLSGAKRGGPERRSAAALPFNPFAKAEEGEYLVLSGLGGEELTAYTVQWTDGDEVVIAVEGATVFSFPQRKSMSRKGDIPLEAYLGLIRALGPKDTIDAVQVADETRTVGDREVSGKKLTVSTTTNSEFLIGTLKNELTLGLFPDLKSIGLGLYVHSILDGSLKGKSEYELVGYGTKDKAIFGKTVAEAINDYKARAEEKK